MKDRLNQIQHQINHLWFEALAREGGSGGELTLLLARIASDVNDAVLMAETPGLKQVDCLRFEGSDYSSQRYEGDEYWHAQQGNGALCGVEVPLELRVIPMKRVPTCPKCIEAFLKGDEK